MRKSPGRCAQLACILEVMARKAGNVHPGRAFDDLTHRDFLASAAAIVPAMDSDETLGRMILHAVEATRAVVSSNANLGIILLLAPLAAATRAESLGSGIERSEVMNEAPALNSPPLGPALNSPPLGKGGKGESSEPKRMSRNRDNSEDSVCCNSSPDREVASDPPYPPLPRGGGRRLPLPECKVPMLEENRHYFRTLLKAVLAATTVADSVDVYRAIRLANPGGLGSVNQEDIGNEPTKPLRDVMALAADRDLVARQYANGFREVWEAGVPLLTEDWQKHGTLERAIVRCQLGLMAAYPDTLILRKAGSEEARLSSVRAAEVLDAGWPDTVAGRRAFAEFDAWLRADGRRRNPGATADLVTACLFVALWQDTIPWHDYFRPFAGLDYA